MLSISKLPAVVSEGLVGLCHLMSILAALDRSTEAVGGVEDLVGETLGHRLLATGAGESVSQRSDSVLARAGLTSTGTW